MNKKNTHYKDYFPHLRGSLKEQIAIQYFINNWACEQWQSDSSIVLKSKNKALWMPEGR